MKPPHKKDAITFQRKRRTSQRSHSLPITNTSSATSHDVFPSSFIIFRTSAPQEKRRMILDIFHLQPAMKLTRLLSDMLVNDSRIILLSGHVSATNRYTDTELVAELLHQRDRSVSQHFCVQLSHFTAFASLAVIDTVNPATSPVCSPSTIVTYPL